MDTTTTNLSNQSWQRLVLDDNIKTQLQEIGMDLKQAQKPVRALFAGAPGTGKTMSAGLLARMAGLAVYRVDLSTVVSKFIGETEKNLEKVFDAAEAQNAILYFDEADALFGKRTEVKDSHDRFANIEVAYLLQKLEAYKGPVILSTNSKANIDPAFLRRLRYAIDFPMPKPLQRLHLWMQAVEHLPVQQNGLPLQQLADTFEVSGGTIFSAVRNAVLATQTRQANAPQSEDLLNEVQKQLEKLG